jgi:hypothetical protein
VVISGIRPVTWLIGLVGLALIVGAVIGHAYGDRDSFQDDVPTNVGKL